MSQNIKRLVFLLITLRLLSSFCACNDNNSLNERKPDISGNKPDTSFFEDNGNPIVETVTIKKEEEYYDGCSENRIAYVQYLWDENTHDICCVVVETAGSIVRILYNSSSKQSGDGTGSDPDPEKDVKKYLQNHLENATTKVVYYPGGRVYVYRIDENGHMHLAMPSDSDIRETEKTYH